MADRSKLKSVRVDVKGSLTLAGFEKELAEPMRQFMNFTSAQQASTSYLAQAQMQVWYRGASLYGE